MASPITQQTQLTPMQQNSPKPAFFATDGWVTIQRIAGVALMALGIMASALAPLSAGASAGLSAPLFIGGSMLFGLTLIQQVIGDAPNCTRAKTSRAVAGALIMLFPVFGWIPAAILWHHSTEMNRLART